jgi:hypothetical protein
VSVDYETFWLYFCLLVDSHGLRLIRLWSQAETLSRTPSNRALTQGVKGVSDDELEFPGVLVLDVVVSNTGSTLKNTDMLLTASLESP